MAELKFDVKITDVKMFIKKLYLNGDRQSILLLGGAGIGKSVVVKEIAEEIAKEKGMRFVEYSDDVEVGDNDFVFVDLRLTEVEPSDLIGVPDRQDNHFVYKPPRWARVLSRNAGILFLDELTMVQRPDVMAVAFKLLLDRKAGFVKLNENVLVVSAGNRPEDNSLAVNLPAPVVNRVIVLNVKEATVEEWGEWMTMRYGDEWEKTVLAFLMSAKGFFKQKGEAETLDAFATPRQWTQLAVKLKKIKLDENEKEALVFGTVGAEAGGHYLAFTKNVIPGLNEFKKDALTWWNGFNESQKYLMMMTVASDNDDEFKVKLMSKLLNVDREFIAVLLKLNKAIQGERKTVSLLTKIMNTDKELADYVKKAILMKMRKG